MKAQVLLPKIFNYPFIYESNKKGNIGDLVEVPFGTKKEIGIIWKNNRSEPKNIKIKNIKRFVKYSINKKLVNFIEWFSTYNMVSVGLVLKMVMGDSDKFFKNKDDILVEKKTKIKRFEFNSEQLEAIKFLEKENKKFDVSVLQGVTGSGKTIVYFDRVKKILRKKKTSFDYAPRNIFNK